MFSLIPTLSRRIKPSPLTSIFSSSPFSHSKSTLKLPSDHEETSPPPRSQKGSLVTSISQLSKAKLSALVVTTGVTGFLAHGLPVCPSLLLAATAGTALCSASANTLNQLYEVENDSLMMRTRDRPLPSGRISKRAALSWAILAGVSGTAILGFFANPTVALLGAGNIALYAGVYTPLKQKSEWGTWVGSVVGAIPPLMGWAAASGGSLMAVEPWFLATLLYLWQFPHFFSLAWMGRKDYKRGGFQMVSVNDPTGDRTGRIIFQHSLALTAMPILAYLLDLTSGMYLVEGMAINSYLMYQAYKYQYGSNGSNGSSGGGRDKQARQIFFTSLWYLLPMTGLFIYHAKRLKETKELEETRKRMQTMCVHDQLMVSTPHLCPPIVGKEMEEELKTAAAQQQQAQQHVQGQS